MNGPSRVAYDVYETLQKHATERKCNLSYNTIARKSGYSRSFVIGAVKELTLLGWVEKNRNQDEWGNRANEYLLVKDTIWNSPFQSSFGWLETSF